MSLGVRRHFTVRIRKRKGEAVETPQEDKTNILSLVFSRTFCTDGGAE